MKYPSATDLYWEGRMDLYARPFFCAPDLASRREDCRCVDPDASNLRYQIFIARQGK